MLCFLLALLFVTELHGKQKGVNFLNGQWSRPKLTSQNAILSFEMLQSSGTDYLALTFCWFQWNISSTTIYPRVGISPTEGELQYITKLAHSHGTKVMIRPLVDPDWSNPETKGTWRGMIGVNFTVGQWNSWFQSYSAFILKFAHLSTIIGADEFSVGGELITPSFQSDHWRELIKQVRLAYSGPILYGANHGNENSITWWDAVDYIGVDAYYNLVPDNPNPSYQELMKAWTPIVNSLYDLSLRFNKSIIFSEIGYCSVTGANTNAAQCGIGPLNLTAQAVLYDVCYQTFWDKDWFEGIFWWAWLTDPKDGGSENKGFTPNGKLSEAVMLKWNQLNL